MSRGHIGIFGMTDSGKSFFGVRLAKAYKDKFGCKLLVLDPFHDPDWIEVAGADFQTGDAEKFLSVAKAERSAILVVDEGGQSIGRYSKELAWITTGSRHWGHRAIIISQRGAQIDRTVRSQLSTLYLFRSEFDDAISFAKEFNDETLRQIGDKNFPQYDYLKVTRTPDPVKRCRLKAN